MKNIDNTEIIIAKLLKAGVLLSATITLIGLVLFLVTGNGGYDGSFPSSLPAIWSGLLAFKPYAVIMLGVLLLILTPFFRVGVSIIVFLREKDYLYTTITAFVFLVLIVSLILGKAE